MNGPQRWRMPPCQSLVDRLTHRATLLQRLRRYCNWFVPRK
jgi:hypothetical protein